MSVSAGTFVLVALAGGVGSVARVVVDGVLGRAAGEREWAGTLAVNVAGSVLLGLLVGLAIPDDGVGLVVGVGLLGGFTTFSTWMVEAVALGEDGRPLAAAGLVVASVGLGAAALLVGAAAG